MKQWFLRFTLRDQLALLIMGAAVAIYVLFMLLILPLERARSEMGERNRATATVLREVDTMASQISELRSREAASGSRRGRNLTAQLNSSAERFKLRINRLQPNSRGAVQLRFENAPLEQLLRWIHELESSGGLLLEELSLSQAGAAGSVNASLRVAAPE